jgi:DNA-binding NarL/FixJ family response regulator
MTRTLSPRQIEVMEAIARGLGDKQIADELKISVDTVGNHMRMIFSKMLVCTRAQAAYKFGSNRDRWTARARPSGERNGEGQRSKA